MDIFNGTLTLDDGARVPVDLGLDTENLSLRTEGRLIGTWPLKYCRVSPSGRGAVLLSLDGEKAAFEPQDLERFSTVAAQRFRASSLADRISVIREVPATTPAGSSVDDAPVRAPRRPFPWRIVGGVASAIVVVAVLGIGITALFGDEEGPDIAGTTLVVPSTIAPPPPIFDQDLTRFTEEWNLTATAFGVPVQIRGVLVPGQFESQLTPYLTLQGRTDADGTVGSIVLVIDPSGETEDDQLALSALGVAIAVANPELEREERGELLDSLGLDVRSPDLTDVDGEAVVGRTGYSLTYFAAFNALLFTLNPA